MALFVENPRLDWLLKHLLLDHRKEPDDFDGRHVMFVEGFHDGLHGMVGDTYDHGGYVEMKKRELDWLTSELNI